VAGFEVVEAGAKRIGTLEPLWRALYDHHAEVGGEVSALRPFAETWRRRQAQYEHWLAGPDAALLLAERGGEPIGYTMVTLGDGAATWDLGERVAEIETLAVLASERGAGVGAALMRATVDWARAQGADALDVGLVHTNDGAQRFYEREGFRPFYLTMVCDLR
jgi:GNAT superfamily N-acetyltransferase